MIQENKTRFLEIISHSFKNTELKSLIISNKRFQSSDLNKVTIRQIVIKEEPLLNFVYNHQTKDITKNHFLEEGLQLIERLIGEEFKQADLFAKEADYHLIIHKSGKSKLKVKKHAALQEFTFSHDHQKERWIKSSNNVYLQELGVVTAEGQIRQSMNDKFRQINRFIEILHPIIESSGIKESIKIADIGSGKGYLTFALYDHLRNNLNLNAEVKGLEIRKELVESSNNIAQKADFEGLTFIEGDISNTNMPDINMLIALHACDTATDEAIAMGIRSNADIIVCAPCCHKQVRKSISKSVAIEEIYRHGILFERQAEILTDTIRSLILEAYGYKTKVFEFISSSHTPKNLLITGLKIKKQKQLDQNKINKIEELKELFGLDSHHLQEILGK